MFEPTEWINVTGVDNMLGSIVLDDGLVTVVVGVVVYGTTHAVGRVFHIDTLSLFEIRRLFRLATGWRDAGESVVFLSIRLVSLSFAERLL
jgi:hypothetical protein